MSSESCMPRLRAPRLAHAVLRLMVGAVVLGHLIMISLLLLGSAVQADGVEEVPRARDLARVLAPYPPTPRSGVNADIRKNAREQQASAKRQQFACEEVQS